jgi:mannuronan 5-epimerase
MMVKPIFNYTFHMNAKKGHGVAILTMSIIRYLFLIFILTVSVQDYLLAKASFASCIDYVASEKEITISCNSASLTEIYNHLGNDSGLHKQDETGVWLLEANILVKNWATLYINSSDTQWLKISSDGTDAFRITVNGSLRIDSTKITSWDNEKGDYGQIDEQETRSPRPFIRIDSGATGTTDITNSEIAYLGYNGDRRSGLNYYAGNGSLISGNSIHHLWRGFYSKGVEGIVFENNRVFNNYEYGVDPHNKTSNMIIRNNKAFDNGGQGIICSLDCFNITIEGNQVYNNEGSGIMFSRGMNHSIARNNTINGESECLFISSSHHNIVYNNTVRDCENALYLKAGSGYNTLYNNTIEDSHDGIVINSGASNNIFYSNKIFNTNFPTKIKPDESINNTLSGNIVKPS